MGPRGVGGQQCHLLWCVHVLFCFMCGKGWSGSQHVAMCDYVGTVKWLNLKRQNHFPPSSFSRFLRFSSFLTQKHFLTKSEQV